MLANYIQGEIEIIPSFFFISLII